MSTTREIRKDVRIIATDGLELSTLIFRADNPKYLLQIIHGAHEYKERYIDFANHLAKNGITTIISDIRGHGKSINEQYPHGYMKNVKQLVDDQLIVTKYIKQEFPNVPLCLFGHSFGSMIARCYIQQHDNDIEKLILSGTVNYQWPVKIGISIAKLYNTKKSGHKYSKILAKLNYDSDGDLSFLSHNKENIEKYIKSSLTSFKYQNAGIYTIFESNHNIHKFKSFKLLNPKLQIVNVVGKDDPITGFEKGIEDSIKSLKKVGYTNIKSIVYENMKHEIINELDNEKVYADILEFLTNYQLCFNKCVVDKKI